MNNEMIPYFVMEGVVDRQSRTIKKLWILCIILVVFLVGSNAGWLWYESQFEEVVTTQKVEQEVETGDGDVNITGIGDIYGESKADNTNDDQNP
jgi:hypothetical protein